MPSNMTLSTPSGRGPVITLRRYGQAAIVRAKAVVRDSAERTYRTAQDLCPVDTGFMKAAMRKDVAENGLSYQVGFDEDDFPGEFYPLFQEFGTTKMPAQPCITPAAIAERPRFRRALAEALSPSRGAMPPGRR